jgi:allophanate hydrolase
VRLSDGTSAVGFACDAVAATTGTDITRYGDWLAALAASPQAAPGQETPATGSPGQGSRGQESRGSLGDVLLTGFTRGMQPGTSRR